ncbi:SDR family NAD(P)-dependent oxidoreductase [Paenarthrobacter sp. NEAU-H11]|uniref:SDR family NAD(P)-dependent oxidoreductase n=1 Tax=Paenarthrobacter sp. NEAU-H11 TaxID=3423924 RepID=UPI003D3269C0
MAAVTGGASGIGFAFARRWLAGGGRVVLMDYRQDALNEAVDSLDEQYARGIVVDVTNNDSVLAGYESIRNTEGRLDAVVNSAGIARPAPAARITDEDWTALLEIHLTGTMRSCRAAYPLLLESGRAAIVNLSSGAAVSGQPGRISYTTAKAGIEGLTRTLAVEWAPDGIRTNAIAPGYVRTALTESLIAAGRLNPDPIIKRTPLARFAEPAEIAEAIYFMASPAASYITGHSLMIDGGLTIDGNWY